MGSGLGVEAGAREGIMIALNLLISLFLLDSGAGTTAFPLLRVAYGPRACAMGESFTALSDDATSIFWNPGGLGTIKNTELFFSHHEWFGGIRDGVLAFVLRRDREAFGVSILVSNIDGIESRGSDQRIREDLSVSSGIICFSYGMRLLRDLSLGVTLKGLYDDLGEVTGRGWGMDIGGIYRLHHIVNLGLNLYNLGPSMHYGRERVKLPSGIRAGICIAPQFPVSVLMDINFSREDGFNFHCGGEVWIGDILAVRGGYRRGPQDIALGGFTYGFGIKWRRLNLDYAFIPYGALGNTHRLSLRVLLPLVKKTTLIINVIDKDTEKPLLTEIELWGNVSLRSTTDSLKGEYKISEIPEGWTKIKVTKDGYHPAFDSIYVTESEANKKLVELARMVPGWLKGYVVDAQTEEPVMALLISDTVEVETDDTGGYAMELHPGIYTINLFPDEEIYLKKSVEVSVREEEVTEQNFYLLKREPLIFEKIHFETAKADILKEFYPILDNIGKIVQDNPKLGLTIAGHTDSQRISTPRFSDNWGLSKARAEAVKEYLIREFGIDSRRLKTESYADTRPLVPNDSPQNMRQNRRVEVKRIKDEG